MSSLNLGVTVRSSSRSLVRPYSLRTSSLHLVRYASLNTAIHKGLRKSQGLGFRGREWSQDDGKQDRRADRESGVVRRYDGFAPREGEGLTRGSFKTSNSDDRSKSRHESSVRSSSSSMRGKGAYDRGASQYEDYRSSKKASSRRIPKEDQAAQERPRRYREADTRDVELLYAVEEFERTGRGSDPRMRNREADGGRSNDGIKSQFQRRSDHDRPSRDGSSNSEAHMKPERVIKSKLARNEAEARKTGFSMPPRIRVGKRDVKDDPRQRPHNEEASDSRLSSKDMRYSGGSPRYEGRHGSHSISSRQRDDVGDRGDQYDGKYGPRTTHRNEDRAARNSIYRGPRHDKLNGEGAVDDSVQAFRVNKNIPISVKYTTPASVFLYGTSTVEAALKTTQKSRRKFYILYVAAGDNREDTLKDDELIRLARKQRVQVQMCPKDMYPLLDKMSGGRPHNGYILEASPLPQLPITSLGPITHEGPLKGFSVDLAYQSREEADVNGTSNFSPTAWSPLTHGPLVLFLDGIKDPGNFGGIIRTANFLGASAIAIAVRNSAPITPVVIKASAGATENLRIFAVKDVREADFVANSRKNGWKVYAAVAPDRRSSTTSRRQLFNVNELDDPLRRGPCLLLLGSEGEGLQKSVANQADYEVFVPGGNNRGAVDSMNVSVAAGILCKAFLTKVSGKPGFETENDLTSHPTAPSDEADDKLF